jgi:hypothetical protein
MSGIIRKKEPGEAWESVADTDSGGGGGLPTGWTQDDQDPASVDTNGGNLTASDGAFVTSQDDSDGQATLSSQAGVISAPSAGSGTCFTADGGVGATVALDAGGLNITNASSVAGVEDGTDTGGRLFVGAADSGTGGESVLTGGDVFDLGHQGGRVQVKGGFSDQGEGGSVTIRAGNGGDTAGSVLLTDWDDDRIIQIGPVLNTLGFFNANPVTRPVVPLTVPVVQDVIDALVALGLVAQHD